MAQDTIVPEHYTRFIFHASRFDSETGVCEFDYLLTAEAQGIDQTVSDLEIAPELTFTERVIFETGDISEDDGARLHSLIPLLGTILGISYFKIANPKEVVLEDGEYSEAAFRFIKKAYSEGLGEYAYRAGLSGLPNPKFTYSSTDAYPLLRQLSDEQLVSPLVPIGGGKDSAVTVAALGEAGLQVTGFAVNPNPIIERVSTYADNPFVSAKREIDPKLFWANEHGALNGHVPVTAMNSLIAVIQSVILGLGPVVMSNESSSSEPTLFWDGQAVNHQWSKSFIAEQLLDEALIEQAGLKGHYFSLLRPFTEMRIASAFSKTSGFDELIVSCNRAFRIHNAEPTWCANCAKCQFVFLIFSAYMSKERLVNIFGTNMYEDESQLEGFRAILGLDHHKPWECVGEQAESVLAASYAAASDDWANTAVMRALIEEAPELTRVEENPFRAEAFIKRDSLPLPHPHYVKAQDAIS